MSFHIKKGDKVTVLSGKDKGKSGKVLKVISGGNRLVVEGTNLAKKHIKRRSENEPGGIKQIPLSIAVSNVALYCSNCDRGVRVGIQVSSDKAKARICKRCQKPI